MLSIKLLLTPLAIMVMYRHEQRIHCINVSTCWLTQTYIIYTYLPISIRPLAFNGRECWKRLFWDKINLQKEGCLMTKTKRVLAFVLVLMLTVAIFALPAMAASVTCPNCHRSAPLPNSGWTTYDTTSCGHSPTGRHYHQRYSGNVICSCGRVFYGTGTRTWCTALGEV